MTTDFLTFQDTYQHLRDVLDLSGQDTARTARLLKKAVGEAYRTLSAASAWKYFDGETQIITEASQSTGTITYTHSSRVVTLVGATWPTTAASGTITIADIRYPIERYLTTTTVTLGPSLNPGANVAALSSYQYQRYKYLLPIEVGDIKEVIDAGQFYQLSRTNVRDIFWRNTITSTDGAPTEWAMFPSDTTPGRWELWLGSSSADARTIRLLFEKRHDNLKNFSTVSGTASVNVATDVATFSTAILTEHHVGSVLRVSTDTAEPTQAIGEYEDSADGDYTHVPDFERLVVAINSTTEAILSSPIVTPVTTRGYRMSSHIDLDVGPMRLYFMRLAEEAFMRLTLDGTEGGVRRTQFAEKNAHTAFIRARIADSKSYSDRIVGMGWNEGVSITE